MRTWILACAMMIAQPAFACGAGDDPCRVPGGEYTLGAWQGAPATQALMFLHGFRESGRDYQADHAMVASWAEAGVRLVLPEGVQRDWSHVGSPAQARNDLAFLDAVADDLRQRHGIQTIWAAGFSQGGSMVWDLACYRGERYAGFITIAGGFWHPLPARCGPLGRLLHLHGTADEIVPMAGRAIRVVYRQGDIRDGWRRLLTAASLDGTPPTVRQRGDHACERWAQAERRLELCLHPGGHVLPIDWISQAMRFIAGS